MAGVRFEDVDLLGALSRIVDLHTQHYKEDFDLDKHRHEPRTAFSFLHDRYGYRRYIRGRYPQSKLRLCICQYRQP